MTSVVSVNEDELLDLAKKMAVLTTAINAMGEACFSGLDTSKSEMVDLGSEIGQELLRLRHEAIQTRFPKGLFLQ